MPPQAAFSEQVPSYLSTDQTKDMRTHFSALFVTGLLASGAHAQITINATDNLPAIGDTFTYNKAAYAAPPAGGADQLFDFSGLTSTGTTDFIWVDPSIYSNADTFPTAQMAVINGPDTTFYASTSAGLERVGERNFMTLLGNDVDLEIIHSNNMLELQLPLTYDQTWTDQVEGTVLSDGSVGSRSGFISGDADAFGSIVLPGGLTAPVLRVYTSINETIDITIGGNPANVAHKRHQYDYFVPWLKMPILTSYVDSMTYLLTVSESGIRYMSSAPVGVSEQATMADGFTLFPNPMQDAVTVNFPRLPGQGARIEVFDALGREVRSENVGATAAQRTLSLAGEEPGCYFVRYRDAAGNTSTQRLVKR